jgi:ribonuclease D
VIDNAKALQNFLPRVKAASWLAIDTEADSLHAYPEKLCLVQISLPDGDELIDPLAQDLKPLFHALEQKELILHGADYDLRLLHRTYQFVPHRIFETMLAARLLGYQAFGLRDLVRQHLGVTLEKGPQKMNWAVRPLTPRMVDYALNDTKYLQPLAEVLKDQLKTQGRLSWHNEICAKLIAECSRPRSPDPDEVWRVKGSDRLDSRGLAILRALWHWREREATAANKPPYFVMSHEKLVAIAGATAQNQPVDHLLPRHSPGNRAANLAAALSKAIHLPPSKYPRPRRPSGKRNSSDQQARFERLKHLRDCRARELALDPTLIASKAELLLLAQDSPGSSVELMDWQLRLLDLGKSEPASSA